MRSKYGILLTECAEQEQAINDDSQLILSLFRFIVHVFADVVEDEDEENEGAAGLEGVLVVIESGYLNVPYPVFLAGRARRCNVAYVFTY